MRIKRLGVVGAGTMGAGIGALAASAGIPVVLLDVPATEGDPSRDSSSEEVTPAKKSTPDAQGCSMSSTPLRNLGGSSMPVFGVLLGLAVLARRRRA